MMRRKSSKKDSPEFTLSHRKSMIHVRGAFSDSIGINNCVMKMQYDDFDKMTRVLISNKLYQILELFFDKSGGLNSSIQYGDGYGQNSGAADFSKFIVSEIFNRRINLEQGYSFDWRRIYDNLHSIIEYASYNEVLDIVWVSCNWIADNYHIYNKELKNCMYDAMNNLFEKEFVGYRFINAKIVQITDKNEISEIESACNSQFEGCRAHIQKAVGFLADREKKDYKNCIKESISAVEAVCKIITNKDKVELKEALRALKDKGLVLHGALEKAFLALYGYASDEGGIRHSERLFESNVTFEEAKFMLVSCSAFINYLIAEYGKAKGN